MLYTPAKLGSLTLQNRVVMAPMTRCRAPNNEPCDLMVLYYSQRASTGLIISEGTSPSPNGLGYTRIPGIFSEQQVAGWRRVADAVHAKGSKLFIQLMHTGRISHKFNMSPEARILAPSAVAAVGEMYTDAGGMQPLPVPEAMTPAELVMTQNEYVQAAKNAVAAGCDGVELHAANGYLLEQFIRPNSNVRQDEYGGGIANRARFVLEVVEACCRAIGHDKVGIRLSPFGVFNDMPIYPEMTADYTWLAQQLNEIGLAYIHLVDHAPMGAPEVPDEIKAMFRREFAGSLILSGGYDANRAEADVQAGKADFIAVGRPLLSNPDLVQRWQQGAALNAPDFSTFYTPGAKGYTDYPFLEV